MKRLLLWFAALGVCTAAGAGEPAIPDAEARSYAARLEAPFLRAKRVVEEQLESRLDVRLELSDDGGNEHAEKSLFGVDPIAFYRPADGTVVVDAVRFDDFVRTRLHAARDVDDAAFVLFVHELLHAYQASVIRERKPALSGRWLRFCCEGHAIASAEAIGRSAHVADEVLSAVRTERGGRFSGIPEEDRAWARQQFYYRLSAEYVSRRGIKVAEFGRLLDGEPSYPEVLGCDADQLRPSRQAVRELSSWASPPNGAAFRPALELDYYEAAVSLCPSAFDDADLCASYRGGAVTGCGLGDGTSADVFLLHFVSERVASAFAARLRRYALLRKDADHREWTEQPDGAFRLGNYPCPGQCLRGRLTGPFACLVVADDTSEAAALSQTCFARLKDGGKDP